MPKMGSIHDSELFVTERVRSRSKEKSSGPTNAEEEEILKIIEEYVYKYGSEPGIKFLNRRVQRIFKIAGYTNFGITSLWYRELSERYPKRFKVLWEFIENLKLGNK